MKNKADEWWDGLTDRQKNNVYQEIGRKIELDISQILSISVVNQ